jgi:hypothetical protein
VFQKDKTCLFMFGRLSSKNNMRSIDVLPHLFLCVLRIPKPQKIPVMKALVWSLPK